jgi:hypothetical protein
MTITQVTEDTYEVSVCGGLRRILITGARIVVRRTGRLGQLVQRLVGFVDATRTRFEATVRPLSGREIRGMLPHMPVQLGIGERLVGQVMRRLGVGQTLQLLAGLAGEPAGLLAASG